MFISESLFWGGGANLFYIKRLIMFRLIELFNAKVFSYSLFTLCVLLGIIWLFDLSLLFGIFYFSSFFVGEIWVKISIDSLLIKIGILISYDLLFRPFIILRNERKLKRSVPSFFVIDTFETKYFPPWS
jgi:hypothetical protein